MNVFLNELKQRGLVAQLTNEEKITTQLNSGAKLYCGFDPTADSLHVGSLLPLITLLRFKKAGHTIMPLIGGATGMIGDPSFKAQERTLNDESTVTVFKTAIISQIQSILGNDVVVVDNNDWTANMNVIEFLRDIGKHFSVNAMINRDSVKSRLEREDQGISFTEFSYQLLQSMDFWHLFKNEGCSMQLGGSDQWGNITTGIDLIHKREGNDAIATGLTIPLVTKSDGTKFGKTESGAVWLSAEKTSPFNFFQFWLKTTDNDIEKLFKMFSFKSVDEINEVLAADKERTKPMAQQLLAEEMTLIVHGQEALDAVLRMNNALFDNNFDKLEENDFLLLEKDGMPSISTSETSLLELLVIAGLAKSKREARDFVKAGAVFINGVRNMAREFDEINELKVNDFKFSKFAILQRGKRNFVLIKSKK
jgi:tyrosyl-tRNA synthetase